MRKIIILFLFVIMIACTIKYTPKKVQHIKGSVFQETETGYYTAELVMKPKQPVVGTNEAHLIIHNYEAVDVPGLRIYAEPYLPGKGLKSDEKTVIEDAGRGLYVIKNIKITEPGVWVLKLTIYGDEISDKVSLILPEVK